MQELSIGMSVYLVVDNLLQVGPAEFCLHLRPAVARDTRRQVAGTISRAGQGPGLQVFPGSISDIDCVSNKAPALT